MPSTVGWRRQWHPTPVLLPGKSHGQRSLVGCIHGVANSRARLRDFTFTFHFSLSCIEEGNGNPLQGSCLENPRESGFWWAAVYGVAQSQTQLKQLSSSSSSSIYLHFVESMEFSRPEYWSGPFPSPGDLPNPGIEPRSPALQADSLLSEP